VRGRAEGARARNTQPASDLPVKAIPEGAGQAIPYSPSGILSAYDRTLLGHEELRAVLVRGIYLPTRTKVYAGFYYDRLREEHGTANGGRPRSPVAPRVSKG